MLKHWLEFQSVLVQPPGRLDDAPCGLGSKVGWGGVGGVLWMD